jgi:hypothetical protein
VITFIAEIRRFQQHGDKTNWTYLEVDAEHAEALNPGVRKAFRVKGSLDGVSFQGKSLVPSGSGSFYLALNQELRKSIRKTVGASMKVTLELDLSPVLLSSDLLECLEDAPHALSYFNTLSPSHKKYFSDWIESAKTEATKVKRISQAIAGLEKKMEYGEMIRASRKKTED